MRGTITSIAMLIGFMVLVSACAPHRMYRSKFDDICATVSGDSFESPECQESAIQSISSSNGSEYLLGFIEFDDQGQVWDRGQMLGVLEKLWERSGSNDLLLVVFVHGWKHSAAPGDKNIQTFRGVLDDLSDAEQYIARQTGLKPRQVVGLYLGWRGGSVTIPYLENITFWDRKNTAQKVGHGGVTEVLSHLESIKQTRDRIVCREQQAKEKNSSQECFSNTRLVVIGHSFGGAVVHTALAQILENRFIKTKGPAGQMSDVEGFGNLVVLLNPAFEANLFTPLSDMAAERGRYFKSQEPVLLVLTSEADGATKTAFPIGRSFGTMFEKNHERRRFNKALDQFEMIDEYDANITAIGHFKPYRTHKLYLKNDISVSEPQTMSIEEAVNIFLKSSDQWQHDHSGSRIEMGEVILERTMNSIGRNPYLVAYVDKRLIKDHNHIDNRRVVDFVKQLILIASYNENQTTVIRKSIK